MEHFVVDDVIHGIPRDAGLIEDTAHYDGVVGWIVVAEVVAGTIAAPGHLRTGQKTVEESRIELLEHFFQIISPSLGGLQPLTSADLAHEVRLSRDVVTGDEAAVAGSRS